MVDSPRILHGVCADQLSGCRCGGYVAPRLLTGHLRTNPPRCTPLCLWILLHPELSFRYRHRELRPLWHDCDWQIPIEPLIHDARTYQRIRLNNRRLPPFVNHLLSDTDYISLREGTHMSILSFINRYAQAGNSSVKKVAKQFCISTKVFSTDYDIDCASFCVNI